MICGSRLFHLTWVAPADGLNLFSETSQYGRDGYSQPQLQTPQTGFLPPPAPLLVPYPVLRSQLHTQPSRAQVASTSGEPGDQLMSVTAREWACKVCSMCEVANEGEKDKL